MTSKQDHANNSDLVSADITWQNNEPFSACYDDVYYAKENGLAESKYVFYDANQLEQRFIDASDKSPLVIFETGFGTGLNFLLTWQQWEQLPDDNKRPLHFISIEKHPLSKTDLKTANSHWLELKHYANKLEEAYPVLVKGQHTITLDAGRVTLTLIFGDVNHDLQDYQFEIDCWYLDGFAPSKNQDMWSDTLFTLMQTYSKPESTFATFTAASFVRKGLESKGFVVSKQKGFGRKREMLLGTFSPASTTSTSTTTTTTTTTTITTTNTVTAPITATTTSTTTAINNNNSRNNAARWSRTEHAHYRKKIFAATEHPYAHDVIIIGAGLAGLKTAHTLARYGLRVALVDKNDQVMQGASGQDQLVMYAKLPSERNKVFNFIERCLCHSIAHYDYIQRHSTTLKFWNPVGVLQLAWNDKEKRKFSLFNQQIKLPEELIRYISMEEASLKSGLTINSDGLWFEKAGWMNPKVYGEFLISHAKGSQRNADDNRQLNLFLGHEVKHLEQNQDKSWTVKSAQLQLSAPNLVIANANDAKKFSLTEHLPIKPLRGQVSSLKNAALKHVNSVVCGEGYLCPSVEGWHHLGATFDLDNQVDSVFDTDNQKNIENVKKWLPEWPIPNDGLEIKARAGLRCTTPDYIPVVGPAPDYENMLDRFAKLRVGANSCNKLYGLYHENLYLNLGHGSKGLFSTPIAAEMIASEIVGSPYPVNETIRTMLSPARFIIKHLKQRRI